MKSSPTGNITPYIKGPLDYDLLLSALSVTYKGHNGAKILLHLYYERGKRGLTRDKFIPFNNYYLKDLGITRQLKSELLRLLEIQQLVFVVWNKGKCPYVKILDREIFHDKTLKKSTRAEKEI